MCNHRKLGSTIRSNCALSCGVCKISRRSCVDNQQCGMWVANGYCSSSSYTRAEKKLNCPKACGMCPKKRAKKQRKPRRKPQRKPRRKPQKKQRPISRITYPPFMEAMNVRINPCTDFYSYACGNYMMRHPATRSSDYFNTFGDLQEKVDSQLMDLITDTTPGTLNAVKTMQVYRDKCMDVQAVETARSTDLYNKMMSIAGGLPMLGNPYNPATFNVQDALVGLLRATGIPFMYDMSVVKLAGKHQIAIRPATFILVDPTAYDDPNQKAKIQAMHDFFTTVVGFVASDQKIPKTYQEIEAAVEDTINFEKELYAVIKAQGGIPKLLSVTGPRNGMANSINFFTLTPQDTIKFSALKNTITQINWDDYVRDHPAFDANMKSYLATDPDIVLLNLKLLQATDAFYQAANPQRLANYLFLQYLLKEVPYLDSRFSTAANQFAQTLDSSTHMSNRPQDCVSQIKIHFQQVAEFLYIQKYLSQENMQHVDMMTENIRSALAQIINGEMFLDASTKAYALKKLAKMKKVIGGFEQAKDPQKLEDLYADLTLNPTESLSEMSTQIKLHKKRTEMKSLSDPNFDISMLSQSRADEVEAYNFLNKNTIYITAAILQSPFLDPKQPAAVNYGSVGFVVAHEFTHGFDNGGADYDEDGLINNWWTPESRKAFDDRIQCLADSYSKLTEPTVNKLVNGDLTLPENIADNGGIRAAFMAYRRQMNGKKERRNPSFGMLTNEQIFFISYGRTFCSSISKEITEKLLSSDSHSPARFRVNTMLSSYPEFAKAFQCKRGTNMNPAQKCVVW
ncbi:Neprilysin-1 [Aphelenchoides besseyi]|nr:Neprilysin-1 [Aphelenchoides besseyi]